MRTGLPRLVIEAGRRRSLQLPIDSLIALAALRELKRLSTELAVHIQREACPGQTHAGGPGRDGPGAGSRQCEALQLHPGSGCVPGGR